MKSIRIHQFGGPEVLVLEEIPDPRCDAGQVLVRVKAVGVNPVDAYIRAGSYATNQALPYTPGADAAGIVQAIGAGVGRFAVGDRVYVGGSLSGAYAELVLCKPSQVHRLPERISFEQGAAINVPYATAYRALFQRARAIAGEIVLVHGATGGVGIAAVQLARCGGMTVIATGGSERGRKLLAELGAHHVLDHTVTNYLDAIPSLTRDHGVDVVLEMLANVNLAKDLPLLAPGGRVAVIGSRGKIEIDPRQMMGRESAILGVTLGGATEADLGVIHAALGAGLELGTLNPVVGKTMKLAEAPLAHQAVMAAGAYGKIVLVP